MNGPEYLADTNALIYLLAGNECMKLFSTKKMAISIISFMEMLSFPGITDEEERKIRIFLGFCEQLQIGESIREKTIMLRRIYKIKLPDAIIAATAMVHGLPLITADVGFKKIEGLRLELLIP